MEQASFIENLRTASSKIEEKSFDDARKILDQINQNSKKDIRFLYTLGQLEFASGNFNKSSDIFQVIVTESAKRKEIPVSLSRLFNSAEENLLFRRQRNGRI